MLYFLAKRFDIKKLRNMFCKIGWHCDIDGYSVCHMNGKPYCKCKWCGKNLDAYKVIGGNK